MELWNGGILKTRGSMDGLVHAAARCMDNGIKNKYKIRKEKLNYGTEYGWKIHISSDGWHGSEE